MQVGTIIAFDGNVCTGKTSLISELGKKNNWNVVEEYSAFFNNKKKLNSKKEYLLTQKKYLFVDKIRKKQLIKETINLLDRSFVSTSAHVWALYRQNVVDIRKEYYDLLCSYIDKKIIIIPNIFIYAICDFKKIKKRCQNRQKIMNSKNNMYEGTKYYLAEDYVIYIDEFNRKFHKLQKSMIVNTGDFNKQVCTKELLTKLGEFRSSKSDNTKLKNDLKKALNLSRLRLR